MRKSFQNYKDVSFNYTYVNKKKRIIKILNKEERTSQLYQKRHIFTSSNRKAFFRWINWEALSYTPAKDIRFEVT